MNTSTFFSAKARWHCIVYDNWCNNCSSVNTSILTSLETTRLFLGRYLVRVIRRPVIISNSWPFLLLLRSKEGFCFGYNTCPITFLAALLVTTLWVTRLCYFQRTKLLDYCLNRALDFRHVCISDAQYGQTEGSLWVCMGMIILITSTRYCNWLYWSLSVRGYVAWQEWLLQNQVPAGRLEPISVDSSLSSLLAIIKLWVDRELYNC